jgi:hypothetical protein
MVPATVSLHTTNYYKNMKYVLPWQQQQRQCLPLAKHSLLKFKSRSPCNFMLFACLLHISCAASADLALPFVSNEISSSTAALIWPNARANCFDGLGETTVIEIEFT